MKVIRIEDFEKELGALTEAQTKEIVDITHEACLRSIPLLVEASPVDTGQYASSWAVERPTEMQVSIGNYAPHAPIIEYGMRGGKKPPIGPLLEWARRVLESGPAVDANGKAVFGMGKGAEPSGYSKEVQNLAFAVQAKIADPRYERKPMHILENAISGIVSNVIDEYRRRGAK